MIRLSFGKIKFPALFDAFHEFIFLLKMIIVEEEKNLIGSTQIGFEIFETESQLIVSIIQRSGWLLFSKASIIFLFLHRIDACDSFRLLKSRLNTHHSAWIEGGEISEGFSKKRFFFNQKTSKFKIKVRASESWGLWYPVTIIDALIQALCSD